MAQHEEACGGLSSMAADWTTNGRQRAPGGSLTRGEARTLPMAGEEQGSFFSVFLLATPTDDIKHLNINFPSLYNASGN